MFAYIDPATGMMIIQIIAAGVLACGVFFRKVFFAPFAFFSRKKGHEELGDTADNQGE